MPVIQRIETRLVTKRFDRPPRNPRSTWHAKHSLLVLLITEDGFTGIGEAWCEGMSPEVLAAFVRLELAPCFEGAELEDVQRIWSAAWERTRVTAKPGLMLSALGAVETAAWDAMAQRLGRPLHRLLGSCGSRVPVYASGGLYRDGEGIDALMDEMSGYVAQGFTAVKMKVGGAPLAVDRARVAAVREAIGPTVRLMVDAVYMLDAAAALRMARALEPFDIWFLEAPVAPGNLPGLRRLTSASPIPIAGNEVAFGLDQFRDLVVEGGIDVVHLDVNQCGGVAEARRIAALAAAFHRPVSFHSATSAVCFAANLQVAASLPNVESVEWHGVHRMLFDRLAAGQFALADGCVVLPDAPGLGLGVSAETLLEGCA